MQQELFVYHGKINGHHSNRQNISVTLECSFWNVDSIFNNVNGQLVM